MRTRSDWRFQRCEPETNAAGGRLPCSSIFGGFRQDRWDSLRGRLGDRLDGGRSITLQPVIYVNVSGSAGLARPLDYLTQGRASSWVRILYFSVRRKQPHGIFILPAASKQRAADQEIGRDRFGNRQL